MGRYHVKCSYVYHRSHKLRMMFIGICSVFLYGVSGVVQLQQCLDPVSKAGRVHPCISRSPSHRMEGDFICGDICGAGAGGSPCSRWPANAARDEGRSITGEIQAKAWGRRDTRTHGHTHTQSHGHTDTNDRKSLMVVTLTGEIHVKV